MTLFLANFATVADWECIQDDGASAIGDCVDDIANPQGILVEHVLTAFRIFEEEVVNTLGDDLPEYNPKPWRWTQTTDRPLSWSLYDAKNELVGVAIVREIEVTK